MKRIWQGVLGILCVAVIAAILFPLFAQTKTSGPSPCLSNLKRIGIANLIYRTEHDELGPPERWIDATLPYTKGIAEFRCPDVPEWGYAMNVEVVCKKVKNEAKTVAVFECDALARNVVANLAARTTSRGRFKTGSNVVFADGHARFVRAGVAP